MKSVVIIGGIWNNEQGFASSFVSKIKDSLSTISNVHLHNGGQFGDLVMLSRDLSHYDAIIWMPNVSNDYVKILPDIRDWYPNSTIIQSKNNNNQKYTPNHLRQRMRSSRANALIEFVKTDTIRFRLHTWDKDCGNYTHDICYLTKSIAQIINHMDRLRFPINKNAIILSNEKTYPWIDRTHPGSYGFRRKHHVHGGIDIYCKEGTSVYSIAFGYVINILKFTGYNISPWWNDTDCIMIYHPKWDLTVNYGEINVNPNIKVGDIVYGSSVLGEVKQVLKKDKGRPMSMLHFETYTSELTRKEDFNIHIYMHLKIDPTKLIELLWKNPE